jgi:hypothetical protein
MLRHVQILLSFAGSLGLMVFGLRMLNDRILYSFGSRIRSRIIAASGQSFRSLIAGSSLTSMFHSSSGLSVILMSMINESLISQEAAFTTVLGAALGHIVPIAHLHCDGVSHRHEHLGLASVGPGRADVHAQKKKHGPIRCGHPGFSHSSAWFGTPQTNPAVDF